MLCNYAELILVLTPSRYCQGSLIGFRQSVFGLPRRRSRQIRFWLIKHFQLVLVPPSLDGLTDENRLQVVLLRFISDQTHTLWASVKRRQEIGVVGAMHVKEGQEVEITAAQVLAAIREDLAGFPGFCMGAPELSKPAPPTYRFPAAPPRSRYVLRRKGFA